MLPELWCIREPTPAPYSVAKQAWADSLENLISYASVVTENATDMHVREVVWLNANRNDLRARYSHQQWSWMSNGRNMIWVATR